MTGANREEVEIKLRIASEDRGKELLTAAGFSVCTPRHFESNVLFDTPDHRLRRDGRLLRVRQVGEKEPLLTYKGPGRAAKHKVREEIQLSISDAVAFAAILDILGLEPAFRYEKYRTEYERPGEPGIATLDHTPIGGFLELEGPPHWIDATAKELGFAESDYILASYGRLYLEAVEDNPSLSSHMVFPE